MMFWFSDVLLIDIVTVLCCCSPEKVAPIVKEMIGHSLITNQTPKSGVKVRQVVRLLYIQYVWQLQQHPSRSALILYCDLVKH